MFAWKMATQCRNTKRNWSTKVLRNFEFHTAHQKSKALLAEAKKKLKK